MTKHTQGPWIRRDRHIVAANRDRLIADCQVDGDCPEEQRTNARLMAAAPEMLAALLACVEYWRELDVPCRVDLHDQVTDAIHKATSP